MYYLVLYMFLGVVLEIPKYDGGGWADALRGASLVGGFKLV